MSTCRTVALVVSLLGATASEAQVLQVEGGSSSLFSAHGGSIELRGPSGTASVGVGRIGDTTVFGFLIRKPMRDAVLSAGDESIDFQLPTDVFGGSRYLPVRSAGIELTRGRSRVRALGGATSATLGAPFFHGSRWGTPIAAIFLDHALAPHLDLFSRNALSERQTTIHGLRWRPSPRASLAASAGLGSGEPYFAAGATADTRWIGMQSAFVEQRAGFRRVVADGPAAAEVDGANTSITLRPTTWWSATAARQSLIDGASGSGSGRVRIEQAGTSVNAAGFRSVVSIYHGRSERSDTTSGSIAVGRRLTRSFDAAVEYYTHQPQGGEKTESLVTRLEESVTPRLTITQAIVRSAGHTTLNLGGEFLSNPVHVLITHQIAYAPLRLDQPFVHVIGVDARLHLLDAVTVQAGTYMTPDGRLRYTIGATLLRAADPGQGVPRSRSLDRYLVRGRVEDAQGTPVAGAVLRVGDEVLITDSEGRFLYRVPRNRRLPLQVLVEEFVSPGRFHVVSGPSNVTPALERDAGETVIVVARRS